MSDFKDTVINVRTAKTVTRNSEGWEVAFKKLVILKATFSIPGFCLFTILNGTRKRKIVMEIRMVLVALTGTRHHDVIVTIW